MPKTEKIPTTVEVVVVDQKFRRKIERLASLSRSLLSVEKRVKDDFKVASNACEYMKLSDEILGFDNAAFRSCQHKDHAYSSNIIHQCSLFDCPYVKK